MRRDDELSLMLKEIFLARACEATDAQEEKKCYIHHFITYRATEIIIPFHFDALAAITRIFHNFRDAEQSHATLPRLLDIKEVSRKR